MKQEPTEATRKSSRSAVEIPALRRGGCQLYFTEAGRRYSLDVAKQSALYKVPPELQREARCHIPAEPLFPTKNCLRFAQEVQACCADAGLFEVDADGGLIKRRGAGLSSTEIKNGIRHLASDEGQDVLSRIGELSRIAQEANDQVAQLVAKR